MSDGALSQAEIDALLGGVDSSFGSGSMPSPTVNIHDQELKGFKSILDDTIASQAQVLTTLLGPVVTMGSPTVEASTRDQTLQALPEEVLWVKIDTTGGIPGEHLYIMGRDTALKVAALANKEDELSDLDPMAINAIQECISNITGTLITSFTKKTGNNNLQTIPAEGKYSEKALVTFPMSDFVRCTYSFKIGDELDSKIWEIYSTQFVKDLVLASGGSAAGGFDQVAGMQSKVSGGGMAASQMAMQAAGMQQQGMQNGMGMQQQGMQQGYGQPYGQQYGQPYGQMGMQQGYGMQMPMGYQNPMAGMNPPNVQSVQYPNFAMHAQGTEQSNISLLMDVFMEMTVELGRTKKPIREILGMGEGTIIELDKLSGEPVDILVNHKLIAKGEVVVIDENFGVRVTEIVTPMERVADMG